VLVRAEVSGDLLHPGRPGHPLELLGIARVLADRAA